MISLPASSDARLRFRLLDRDDEALSAAMDLLERHDPASLDQALALLADGPPVTPPTFEVLAQAWDRYFHIRNLPWD